MVEQRSPKPLVACSNRVSPAKMPCFARLLFLLYAILHATHCVFLKIPLCASISHRVFHSGDDEERGRDERAPSRQVGAY